MCAVLDALHVLSLNPKKQTLVPSPFCSENSETKRLSDMPEVPKPERSGTVF